MMQPMDIRQWRKARGLTQVQLAGHLDLPQSSISRMEKGDYTLDRKTELALIALDKVVLPKQKATA